MYNEFEPNNTENSNNSTDSFASNLNESSNDNSTVNGSYSYTNQQLHNRAKADNYFNPQSGSQPHVASYSTYPETGNPIGTKKLKSSRKYPISAIIACCLICSILGGGIGASVMLLTGTVKHSVSSGSSLTKTDTNSNGKTDSVINVTDDSTETLIMAVAAKASPSVVGIRATAQSNSFWGQTQEQSGEGSGIIYKADGYIITNYHVISTAVEAGSNTSSITVYLPDDPDTAIPAKVIGYYSESDLAVLKIEKTGLPAIEIGNSDELKAGQTVVAIGNPGGLQYMGSVSKGIISGLNRTLKLEGIEEMALIQTDAAINPGNSGGALVNTQGQLIGVNSSKIVSDSYENMGFAIPVNYVKKLCDDIIQNKDVKRAYIGVKISTEYDGATLQKMGYPAGALVESVVSGSPANQIGIKAYDIITEIGGVAVSNYKEYNNERLKHKPNETITMKIYRNGKTYDVQLTLGESIS